MKIRKAFIMSVNAGAEEEYEERHNPIWPELEKVLKDHGVSNYSIFLYPETRQLFGYAEIEGEEQWAAIASTNVCRRWWKHMASGRWCNIVTIYDHGFDQRNYLYGAHSCGECKRVRHFIRSCGIKAIHRSKCAGNYAD